jgi:hypothetical protein
MILDLFRKQGLPLWPTPLSIPAKMRAKEFAGEV